MRVDHQELFVMACAWRERALHVRPSSPIGVETALELFRGKVIREPIKFEWQSGSRVMDLTGTTFPPLLLISRRTADLFTGEEFSGWSTYPVTVTGRDREELDGLLGFAIVGRCGPVDDSRSTEVLRLPPVAQGRPYRAYLGLYFGEESWDGADFFIPDGTARVIVTRRVRDFVMHAKLSNFYFTKLTEVERTAADLASAS